jgi:hypothetical protein
MAELTKIIEAFSPSLTAGLYDVTVDQDVMHHKQSIQKVHKTMRFAVDAARFAINSTDIYSVYPPENTTGQYVNHLPHIVFNRRTLPWERTIDGNVAKDTPLPWMAVILLDQEDMKSVNIVQTTLKDVIQGDDKDDILRPKIYPATKKNENLLTLMSWENMEKQKCLTMDLSAEQYRNYMPAYADLPYMSHSKEVHITHKDPNGIGDVQGDVAYFSVLTGNRSISEDMAYTAVLVSLEGHQEYLESLGTIAKSVRLVVLSHWSFVSHGTTTFETLVQNIHVKEMSVEADGDSYLTKAGKHGYFPMPHHMRNGAKTYSWYRGPLIPNAVKIQDADFILYSCSDAAMYYDKDTGMMDISLAAAWELGKTLALQNKEFSKAMVTWHAHPYTDITPSSDVSITKSKLIGWLNSTDEFSLQTETKDEVSYKPFADEVTRFLMALAQLEGIPLSYMIPDSRYITDNKQVANALSIFYIDPKWIAALLDGALSIGRFADTHINQDMYINKIKDIMTNIYGHGFVTGFLLHSRLVSGWRGTEIKVYSDASSEPLLGVDRIRFERITPDIFLGIFRGEINKLIITQPYEGLHYGMKKENEVYKIPIKDKDGNSDTVNAVTFSKAVSAQDTTALLTYKDVLSIQKLAMHLAERLKASKFTSAEYSFQMIDSPVKAIIPFHLKSKP